VRVVSSRYRVRGNTRPLPRRAQQDDIPVYRVGGRRGGNSSLGRRAVDYIRFHAAVVCLLAFKGRAGDLVVLKTDPPLLQLITTAVVRLKGGKVVNWLQDIYPEIAGRLGLFPGPQWLLRLLAAWRDRALRAAAANVVVSERMAGYLTGRGVDNVRVIANWSDAAAIRPLGREVNPLRSEWGLQDAFVVMYSGNFGRVHAFGEVIDAVHLLSGEAGIRFVFVGSGAGLDSLRRAVSGSGTRNALFKPLQPRDVLRFSLALGDLHLVTLKPAMEDLVMPSKLQGVLAAGRPVAFIGEPDSHIAKWVRQHDVGVAFAPGDGAGLAAAIRRLARDRARIEEMGRNARRQFEQEFTRSQGMAKWRELVARVAEPEQARECP
jgi:glycosyltransferase involved in cell wall biosynthesis